MPAAALRAESNAAGIVVLTACLLVVGLVMVFSASAGLGAPGMEAGVWEGLLGRQAVFPLIGFIALLLVSRGGHLLLRWRPGRLLQPSIVLFLMSLAAAAVVLIPSIGTERNGARRWLQVGPERLGLTFQPSELVKVALVVVLAAMLAGRKRPARSFFLGLLPACLAIGAAVGLVGMEDFGTAALVAGVGAVMLLAGGARLLHLVALALPGVAAMAWMVISKPYRVARLTTFLNIWEDPQGAGYHPIQSLVTIASGGWTGRGLGAGIQKYGYLPEARSDFIFSVICEETGVVGACLVIVLFVALLWFGWRVMSRASGPFEQLLAFGFTMTVTLQAAMNVAVATVCAPTKGISLPLVSAGGSGVVFLCAGLGLLVSAARHAPAVAGDWEAGDRDRG